MQQGPCIHLDTYWCGGRCGDRIDLAPSLTARSTSPAADVEAHARRLATRPDVAMELALLNIAADSSVAQAVDKANGNINYLYAAEWALDAALARASGGDRTMVRALLELSQLPDKYGALCRFFLRQIKAAVARKRIELTDIAAGVSGQVHFLQLEESEATAICVGV